MFEYLDLQELSGVPFTVTEKPIAIYKTSQNYTKEADHVALGLPEHFSAYLVEESKAPYAKIQDLDGKEINNLVIFPQKDTPESMLNCRVMVNGQEQRAISISHDFFNYRSPVMVQKGDGNVEKYRRKWLSHKLRCNVVVMSDAEIKVYDYKTKGKTLKKVKHGKLDIPFYNWESDIEPQMVTFREAMEKPDMALSDFEITVTHNPQKPPLEKYSYKVSKRKTDVDFADAKKQFEKRTEDYVPPANPF